MSTIVENLQRIIQAKEDISAAIISKGGTVNIGDGLEEFPNDIGTIPSGGSAGGVIQPVYFSNNLPLVCNTPVSGAWWNAITRTDDIGTCAIGKVINFHSSSESTNTYDMQLECDTYNKTLTLSTVDTTDGPQMKISGVLPRLRFAQTTTGSEYDNGNCGISAYPGNVNGVNMTIQSGGNIIVGSGEYPTNWYNLADKSGSYPDYWADDGEQTYIGSDNNVVIHTNAQTIANRKTFVFANDFNLALGSSIAFVSNTAESPVSSVLTSTATTTSRRWTLPNATGTVGLYTVLYTSTTAPSATSASINLNSSKTMIGVYDYLDIWVYVGTTTRLAYIKLPLFTAELSQAPIYFQTSTSYTTKYVYLDSNGYALKFVTAGSSDSTKCSFAKVIGVKCS